MDQVHVAYSILLFGAAREIGGGAQLELQLPSPCSVGELRGVLNGRFPALGQLRSYAVAVDRTFAHDGVLFSPQSEVAVIPPVSGG